MGEAIRYNLANLTNFSGRDSRSTFWFYVLFLVILQIVISIGLSVLASGSIMVDAFHSAKDGTDQVVMQQHIVMGMGNMVRITMWGGVVLSFLMTLMLVAAFTRRLHDSNKPGWIAGVAVVVQLLALALTIGMIGEMVSFIGSMKVGDPAAMQAAVQAQRAKYALNGLLGWIPLLLVIIFGVWPSSDGDNRYGAEPDHI